MDFKVGEILDGKVSGIAKFGAFIALDGGKSGLVHISEIANSYVNDINEHLKVGQAVKVKVINVDEKGRINLSIKQAEEKPQQAARPVRQNDAPRKPYTAPVKQTPAAAEAAAAQPAKSGDQAFEDKLKQFMQISDTKISELNRYNNKKNSRRNH